jgi:hypothetical protein
MEMVWLLDNYHPNSSVDEKFTISEIKTFLEEFRFYLQEKEVEIPF